MPDDAGDDSGERIDRGPLWELTVSRIREALRDPQALFWTFAFPVLVLIGLGVAFRAAPPSPESVALACSLPAGACTELRAALAKQPAIAVRELELPNALAELRRGKLALAIEAGGSALDPSLVYHHDPSRKEARTALFAVQLALGQTAAPRMRSREQAHTEVGGRYVDYLMPGIIALNLLGSGVWGVGYSIAEQRRRKLMRQLATTPMRRSHYLLSYMLSRLVFLVPEVALLLVFGVLAFGTPVRGSLWAIAALSLAGSCAFSALGVLIAARADNSEAIAGWANVVMMPMWLFSGVFFNYELFPVEFHPLIRALPLTALSDGLRAVTNEAASLTSCTSELLVLAAWSVVSFALAMKLFRWQ
ncbi:MAG TPA: ABC transporter permease [Polyangiales bacterium]|nr:ABC transporter permease [Polyangiales bacterium]